MRDLDRRRHVAALRPGQELWEDNAHRLAARIRREHARGRVREVMRWEVSPGLHAAVVTRLKPRPTRRRVAALWASGGAVAAGGMAAATWWVAVHLEEILTALLALALTAGGLMILVRVLSGHRATCAGLHCPGCRH